MILGAALAGVAVMGGGGGALTLLALRMRNVEIAAPACV
jgi:hypothetical protein